MINKQRKPLQCRSFHWPWLLFTFLALKQYVFERARSGTLSFTITVATNQRIQAVTIAKVLFFLNVSTLLTDGALFNFY